MPNGCCDSILAAPIALDLVILLDLAKRTPELASLGLQEWLSLYFKSPMTVPGVYPEHDLFIQSIKLKNTLRHIQGEEPTLILGWSTTTERSRCVLANKGEIYGKCADIDKTVRHADRR